MSGGEGEHVVVHAPAKVNLDLCLRGRRDDGFHEVETTMLALDRCDLVTLRRASSPAELTLDGPAASADVPRGPSNLAWRAAVGVLALARERSLVEPGIELAVHLEKHVPARAGLGGGSSDAAAAALGAALLLGIDADDPEILALLATLGADCSFFLAARRSGAALCRGRGERVHPLPPPADARVFAVLTPEGGARTADVYAALAPGEVRSERRSLDYAAWNTAALPEARAALANDLEAPALRAHPELAAWRELLDAHGGGHFRLAGSGSSFFGLFADQGSATAFLERLSVARKGRDHGLHHVFVAAPRRAGVGR